MKRGHVRMVLSWAINGLWFHRTRSVLTVLAIGLATCLVTSAVGFYAGCDTALDHSIEAMGYQVLVTGKGCPHEAATLILRGGTIPMYIREDVYRHIASQPEVADSTRFLLQTALLADGTSHQLYTGIDEAFRRLKPGVEFQRGDWFSTMTADEVILGFNVAEYNRLGLGDHLSVRGREMVVIGVLAKLGTQDDGTVFMPLKTAQAVFERGDRMTGIGLRLSDLSLAAQLIDRIYEVPSVQVVRMSQVRSQLFNVLRGVRSIIGAFAGIAVIVALLGIVNAALLAVFERSAEMGVLRAIGCPSGTLFLLMWSESLLLSSIGVGVGMTSTLVLRSQVEHLLRATLNFVPAGRVIDLSPGVLLGSGFLIVGLCMVAAIYPAWKACRVPPIQSIRGRTK